MGLAAMAKMMMAGITLLKSPVYMNQKMRASMPSVEKMLKVLVCGPGTLLMVIFFGLGFVSGGMGVPSLAQMRGDLKWWLAMSSFWNA